MAKKHRYTGDWPPIDVLKEIPNWEYALDEEGTPGQDETTLRPQSTQSAITNDTVATAATVVQADGSRRMGIVSLYDGKIDGVDVLIDDTTCWRVNKQPNGWEPYVETWLSEEERNLMSVSITDATIFPITVTTLLPLKSTGKALIVRAGRVPTS